MQPCLTAAASSAVLGLGVMGRQPSTGEVALPRPLCALRSGRDHVHDLVRVGIDDDDVVAYPVIHRLPTAGALWAETTLTSTVTLLQPTACGVERRYAGQRHALGSRNGRANCD